MDQVISWCNNETHRKVLARLLLQSGTRATAIPDDRSTVSIYAADYPIPVSINYIA